MLLVLAAGFTAVHLQLQRLPRAIIGGGRDDAVYLGCNWHCCCGCVVAAGVVYLINKFGGLNTIMQNVKEFFIKQGDNKKCSNYCSDNSGHRNTNEMDCACWHRARHLE